MEKRFGQRYARGDPVKTRGRDRRPRAEGTGLGRSQPCQDLDCGLLAPELGENAFLEFEPFSVRLVVKAAVAN